MGFFLYFADYYLLLNVSELLEDALELSGIGIQTQDYTSKYEGSKNFPSFQSISWCNSLPGISFLASGGGEINWRDPLQGRKRLAFTAEQKLHIIREIEGGRSKSDVSRALGLASSTVATIWKNREGVLNALENQVSKERPPSRTPPKGSPNNLQCCNLSIAPSTAPPAASPPPKSITPPPALAALAANTTPAIIPKTDDMVRVINAVTSHVRER